MKETTDVSLVAVRESYTLLNKRIALIYMPKKIVIKPE